MDPAVFLDRDNTLIRNDGDLGDPEQVELFQGAASVIASLCGLGFKVVVVTNQGGVARGKYTEEDVEAVHERIRQLVAAQCTGARIDRFYYCPFHPQAAVMRYKKEHPWRKPQPGMILQAAEDMHLDLRRSWMIGDQMRDIEAGDAAGVRTILLRPDAEQLQPLDVSSIASVTREEEGEGPPRVKPRYIAKSLVEAVRIVAQKRNALDEPDAPPPDVPAQPAPVRKWDAAAVARLQRKPEREPTTVETADSKTKSARPFRPWTAPVEEVPVAETKPSRSAPTEAAAAVEPEAEPAPPAVDEAGPAPPQAERGSSAQLHTLRQILQELRNQREVHGQFNSTSIIVLVMLVMAIVCYVAALMLGGADPSLFLKLFATTVVILLSCIVGLLLRR